MIYGRCPVWEILGDGCTQSMPREIADRAQGDLRDAITRSAEATNAEVLDLRDYFCPKAVCTTRRGELVLYSDGGHLSVAASNELSQVFAQRIKVNEP